MILIDVFSRCNAVIIYVFHCNAVRRVEKKFRLSCFCVIWGFYWSLYVQPINVQWANNNAEIY